MIEERVTVINMGGDKTVNKNGSGMGALGGVETWKCCVNGNMGAG